MGQLRLGADVLLCPGDSLHRARRLSALSQSMAADPLAALDDAAISRPLARGRQPLSHAAARRRRRQPRPAHCRRHQPVRRPHAFSQHWIAQRDRHAVFLRGDPVDALGSRPAPSVRRDLRHSGLSGVGGAALRAGRNHPHSPRGLAARLAQFSATAVRGRLPLQPGPGAGEFRTNCAAQRRNRRTRAVARSLQSRGRQLPADHAAHQAADLSDRGLRAGFDGLSLHRDQPRVFRRRGSARWTDADRVRVHQRADARSRSSSTPIDSWRSGGR